MAIENCERCGTLYHKTIKNICGKCVQQEEEDYKKVRLYLKRHKTVEITTVSEDTGVDLDLIYQFLQEGRIVLGSGVASGYPCKQCGTAIQSGSLCSTCEGERNNLQQTLAAAAQEQPAVQVVEQPKKPAFHTKD